MNPYLSSKTNIFVSVSKRLIYTRYCDNPDSKWYWFIRPVIVLAVLLSNYRCHMQAGRMCKKLKWKPFIVTYDSVGSFSDSPGVTLCFVADNVDGRHHPWSWHHLPYVGRSVCCCLPYRQLDELRIQHSAYPVLHVHLLHLQIRNTGQLEA